MESLKGSIQQRLDKIKYNYLLFFNPGKIKISDNIIVDGKIVSGLIVLSDYNDGIKKAEKIVTRLQNMENKSSDNIETVNQDLIEYQNILIELKDKREKLKREIREEENKQKKKIYKDKAKFHEKLGAKRFQKFVKKLDKAKFKFIKQILKEDRVIKWTDQITDYRAKQKLKCAKNEKEKTKIIQDMKREKVLVRKQLKEERSINYYQGVDKRIEFFYKYIERNKTIHKNALLINGLLLITSIGLGIANVPVLPFLLGTYQIAAGFKNFQCINAQDYYLSLMNMRKQQIVKRNLIEIKKTYQENTDLISALQKGINEGKNLYSDQGILDSVKTLEALQQLKATIIAAKQSQDARIDEAIIGNQMRRR